VQLATHGSITKLFDSLVADSTKLQLAIHGTCFNASLVDAFFELCEVVESEM